MPYRFKIDEPVEKGFRRIAREQFEVVLSELASPDMRPKGVHECRKALKRLRALVRLVGPSLGSKRAKRLGKSLADAGRMLASRRDEAVLRDTVSQLAAKGGPDAAAILAPWLLHFGSEAEQAQIDPQSIERMRVLLRSEAETFGRAKLKHRGFAAQKGGLETSYRRARKALKDAYREPSDESFHTLRKTVQWHWRQMSLLARAWPDEYAVRVEAARGLSQALGDDHDLAMLIAATIKATDFSAEQKEAIVELCFARQQEIRASVGPSVNRLFAEKPDAFIARMAAYWKCGHAAPFPDIVPIVRSQANARASDKMLGTVTTLDTAGSSSKAQSAPAPAVAVPSQRRA
ncbi:metal-chelation protein CHAD [Hyphomicrobium methylovorum]|uniref:CHAD domain-containing protein n=1 Tax=Hyphomicrobium methylovorum TaxID=84 RepID=UPI0015E78A8F|nr:CHAD domain-containing protein [Hyphomicrobium methylovorum]MBA2126789.1 metal-chelation protein CHAD [Hyphomicrobium methylovorum]